MWCRDGGDRRRETEDRRRMTAEARYKFQRLQVYDLALYYLDRVYRLAKELPDSERFNLCSHVQRAATSIVLNIAEGSTGQSDAEQNRFLGLALRSYLETVACLDIIERRGYLVCDHLGEVREAGHELFIKLQSFRKALASRKEKGDRKPKTEDGNSGPRSSVPGLRSVDPAPQSPVVRPRSPVRRNP